jgi:hypothetical protein
VALLYTAAGGGERRMTASSIALEYMRCPVAVRSGRKTAVRSRRGSVLSTMPTGAAASRRIWGPIKSIINHIYAHIV